VATAAYAPGAQCGAFDGARGYVINAINWAGNRPGLAMAHLGGGRKAAKSGHSSAAYNARKQPLAIL
jgi:hypothetical protein